MIKRREIIERIVIYATFEESLDEFHMALIDEGYTEHTIKRIGQRRKTKHSVKITYERKIRLAPTEKR